MFQIMGIRNAKIKNGPCQAYLMHLNENLNLADGK